MKQTGPVVVLTLVCLTCGNEHFYDESVPPSVRCEKCGGIVFRQYTTPTEPDEASIAQLEAQERNIALDDVSPRTAPDDVRDLDSR
jgi:DNA-directed RNA polymerase subunit RPC12/RpoP